MIRKLLLALLLSLSVSPAYAENTYPVDKISEQKFPTAPKKLVDELAYINKYVNATIIYEDDMSHYGDNDLWVQDPADHRGDCEDYALTKLHMLETLANGDAIDPSQMLRGLGDFHFVYVDVHYNAHDGRGWQIDGHEILAVRMPDKSVAYLDLNNDELMTRKELTHARNYGLETAYYEFYDWVA